MSDPSADGRIGLVVPSSNTSVEPEFRRFLPDGVTVHAARMSLESVTVDALDAMSDGAERAATLLGHADVDVVAYACTTGSLLHGPGFDAELEDRLAAAAGAPAVATARSVVRALDALDAERIAVATPYTAALDRREAAFLSETGHDVITIEGRGIEANTAIGVLDPGDAREQAAAMYDSVDEPIDAVFVSCTNYRSLAAVEPLEREFGVPVVTSNGATLWDACGVASVSANGPGALFDHDRRLE